MFRWKPEDQQCEEREEYRRHGKDVGGEHHLSLQVDGEAEYSVLVRGVWWHDDTLSGGVHYVPLTGFLQ